MIARARAPSVFLQKFPTQLAATRSSIAPALLIGEYFAHGSDVRFLPPDNEEAALANFSLQLEGAGMSHAAIQVLLHFLEKRLEFIEIFTTSAACNFFCRTHFCTRFDVT